MEVCVGFFGGLRGSRSRSPGLIVSRTRSFPCVCMRTMSILPDHCCEWGDGRSGGQEGINAAIVPARLGRWMRGWDVGSVRGSSVTHLSFIRGYPHDVIGAVEPTPDHVVHPRRAFDPVHDLGVHVSHEPVAPAVSGFVAVV
jgi:hypothetical protein